MKRILAILAAAACLIAAQAEPLTPEQALKRAAGAQARALHGFPSARGMKLSRRVISPSSKEPVIYVFKGEGSLLIAGADDKVQPVLGYATGDVSGKMPPEMEWWLKQYARQIEYMDANPRKFTDRGAERVVRGDMTPIEPLMKSKWSQDTPYNNYTPLFGERHAPTGCGATAAAQIMYYFRYPTEPLHGTLSYNWNGTQLSLSLDGKRFNWSAMKPEYVGGQYTPAEGNAVASLMQAVGYGSQMGYGPNGSGAYTTNVLSALKFFGYSSNANYQKRGYSSTEEWGKMIYDNLRNYGPVFMAGFNAAYTAGHAFVCDGYRGYGYFHFNWGWGGSYDGYFLLDALSPSPDGGCGNYSFSQEAIFGLKPASSPAPSGNAPISINGNMKFERPDAKGLVAFTSDATGRMFVENVSGADGRFVFALEVTRRGGGTPIYGPASSVANLKAGAGIRRVMLKMPDNLADGTYVIQPVVRKAGEQNWQHLNHASGATSTATITVANGKVKSMR